MRIYCDRIAATPLLPEVLAAMSPYLGGEFGNPQSLHSEGQRALAAIDEARERVAALLAAAPEEIVFTASGSEANNLAVKGLAPAHPGRGKHVVVSAIEHASVLNAARALERAGFRTTAVPVDRQGLVDPGAVAAALAPDTALVSIQTASSEVGTLEPVAEIAAACRARKILFHTDAVAAAGSVPLDVRALGVDALSLAGSAFGGPKGAGALYLRKGVKCWPLVDGGLQENGRRAGLENVPGVAGLGRAAELAAAGMAGRAAEARAVRDLLLAEIPRRIESVVVTGHPSLRLPWHASFCVEAVEGEGMLLHLDMRGVAVSSGSACTSKSLRASHVLLAMGLDHALAQGSIVFSLLDGASPADAAYILDVFPPIVARLRAMSPLWTKHLQEKG